MSDSYLGVMERKSPIIRGHMKVLAFISDFCQILDECRPSKGYEIVCSHQSSDCSDTDARWVETGLTIQRQVLQPAQWPVNQIKTIKLATVSSIN